MGIALSKANGPFSGCVDNLTTDSSAQALAASRNSETSQQQSPRKDHRLKEQVQGPPVANEQKTDPAVAILDKAIDMEAGSKDDAVHSIVVDAAMADFEPEDSAPPPQAEEHQAHNGCPGPRPWTLPPSISA